MIRVNDDYFIRVDSDNYTACRDKHKTDKKGNALYTVVGYYSNLEGAIRGIIKDINARAFDADTYTLQEALEVIKQSNKVFIDMLKAVLDDGK